MIDAFSVAAIVRVVGTEVEAQANACGPRIVAGRASTVVVTIRETMARTRGRIALMRVCGGRRMLMAWAWEELNVESVVAKLEREVVVLARKKSRPHRVGRGRCSDVHWVALAGGEGKGTLLAPSSIKARFAPQAPPLIRHSPILTWLPASS